LASLPLVTDLHIDPAEKPSDRVRTVVLEPAPSVPCRTLTSMPGLFLLPGFFSEGEQVTWFSRAVREYSRCPRNNLSNLSKSRRTSAKNSRWEHYFKEDISLADFRKLSWANLGIFYDWGLRQYDLDLEGTPMCPHLLALSQKVVRLLGMSIRPETALINFYAAGSKRPMGGHRDDAEFSDAPIISASLGCTAVFLISHGHDEEPEAVYLKSGDVLVMSGKSRLAVHAVAQIVPDTCPESLVSGLRRLEGLEPGEGEKLAEFARTSRVNFNVRQVIADDSQCKGSP